jgi:hypothetical protein
MPTEVAGGSQLASIGTEHTLTTSTANKVFVLVVDLANLASGDTVELRIYTIARAAGSERQAYMESFVGAQTSPMAYSVPVPANISCKATLKQTAGTGRSFSWALLSLP